MPSKMTLQEYYEDLKMSESLWEKHHNNFPNSDYFRGRYKQAKHARELLEIYFYGSDIE